MASSPSLKQYLCSKVVLKLFLCLVAICMVLLLLRSPYTPARLFQHDYNPAKRDNPARGSVHETNPAKRDNPARGSVHETNPAKRDNPARGSVHETDNLLSSLLFSGDTGTRGPQPVKDSFKSSRRCQMESCFDFSRCSLFSGFPVYFYPPKVSLASDKSTFASIIDNFSRLGKRTQDPQNTCVFVVLFGGSDSEEGVSNRGLEENLRSLPFWNRDGTNHVLINLADTNQDYFGNVDTGRALVAQSAFLASPFRQNYDVIIPPWIKTETGGGFSSLPSMDPARRGHLLSFWGEMVRVSAKSDQHVEDREEVVASLLRGIQSKNKEGANVSIRLSCEASTPHTAENTGWKLCGEPRQRESVLSRSTFALLVSPLDDSFSSTASFQTRLYEALKNGAVPVILGAMHHRLPFSELLSWEKATLSLAIPQAGDLIPYLRSFEDNDIAELRRFGRLFWESYFSSPERIVATTLAVVRTRLRIPSPPARREPAVTLHNIQPGISFQDTSLGPTGTRFASVQFQRNFSLGLARDLFNRPGDPFSLFPHTPYEPVIPTAAKVWGPSYGAMTVGSAEAGPNKQFSSHLGGNVPQEQFTVMILTYKRVKSLILALERLNNLPFLNKVIIVWNDPEPPASDIPWPSLNVPVEVLKQRANSLNNRFLPFDSIETECILSLDDDVVLSHERIILGFKVWREERERIVGYFARFHKWSKGDNRWLYTTGKFDKEMSIMITSATFFHAYYLFMYSYVMPEGVRNHISKRMNCEDIAMNFLVAHLTRRPPIKVKAPWKPHCPGCGRTLSSKGDHLERRHECMNVFAKEFGYMPLLYTAHTVESVPPEDGL